MPVGSARLIILVAAGTDIADDAVERVETALFVMGPITAVLAGLAASILAAATLRPVERMQAEAASIGEHDPQRRLAVPRTRDEVAALGTTMSELLDRLQSTLFAGFVTPSSTSSEHGVSPGHWSSSSR
jgi:hypothetical protein